MSGVLWGDSFTSKEKFPSITRQPFSLGLPPARQPTASAPVHASGALWGYFFISENKSPSTTCQLFSLGPPTTRQLAASAFVYASGALLGEFVGQDFANKDKETTSGSQPGPQVPFAGGRHPSGKLYPGPLSGSRTYFDSNSPHLFSSSQLTSSPMVTIGRDKLPAGSYLSTSKGTVDTVVIEDELEDIEDIEDN